MSKYEGKTYQITAPLVMVGAGEAGTYLYQGGIIPAGFATDDQIEHHLAIKAIKEIELNLSSPAGDEIDETELTGQDPDGKPVELLDGKSFDDWRLDDLRELVKTEAIALEGATSKADVYRRVLAVRATK